MPRPRLWFAAIVLFVAAVAAAPWAVSGLRRATAARTAIAWVNGEPIAPEEFQLQLAGERAIVSDLFHRRYGTPDGPGMWSEAHDGRTAKAEALRRALDDSVRIKVEEMLLRRHGLMPDISYAGFVRQWETENRTRAATHAKGEPVYGPLVLNEPMYFRYFLANAVGELKRRLAAGELALTEAEMAAEYEVTKGPRYERGAVPLAKVRAEVAERAFDHKFDEYLAVQVRGVKVAINQPRYDALQVE